MHLYCKTQTNRIISQDMFLITADGPLWGRTAGLCGSLNGNPYDDFAAPDGMPRWLKMVGCQLVAVSVTAEFIFCPHQQLPPSGPDCIPSSHGVAGWVESWTGEDLGSKGSTCVSSGSTAHPCVPGRLNENQPCISYSNKAILRAAHYWWFISQQRVSLNSSLSLFQVCLYTKSSPSFHHHHFHSGSAASGQATQFCKKLLNRCHTDNLMKLK